MGSWIRTYRDLGVADDVDDDNHDNDERCAPDEHSEDLGEDDFAFDCLSPKQQVSYWVQGKKGRIEGVVVPEQQPESEDRSPDSAVSISSAGSGGARCIEKR